MKERILTMAFNGTIVLINPISILWKNSSCSLYIDIFLFKMTLLGPHPSGTSLPKACRSNAMYSNNNKPLIPSWHYISRDPHVLNGIHQCQSMITFIHYLYLLELRSSQRNTQCRWKSRLFVTIRSWRWHPICPVSNWMFAQHLMLWLFHWITKERHQQFFDNMLCNTIIYQKDSQMVLACHFSQLLLCLLTAINLIDIA